MKIKEHKALLVSIYHGCVYLFFSVLGVLPAKKVILFESFHGKQFSDNPRAIYEYFRKEHSEYQLIWAVKKGFEAPFVEQNVPYVTRLHWKWMLTVPRARYWIFNTRMPLWMKKPAHTIYIQTWHGTPLKKLGGDIQTLTMPGASRREYRRAFKKEAKRWDFLISPNHYSSTIFQRAFYYEGPILEIGYPRNDVLTQNQLHSQISQTTRAKLRITTQRVLLYAPTWRDNQYFDKGKYQLKTPFPFAQLLERDPQLTILVRGHYLVGEKLDFSSYGQRVIDTSHYPDIRELYIVADELVTDYSSVFFDYSYLKRPITFYMYDQKEYQEQTRGLYFDPEKVLPGPIVTTEEELVDVLTTQRPQLDQDKLEAFRQKFCPQIVIESSQEIYNLVHQVEKK